MANSRSRVDLLLLNCSNLPYQPVFPYAFVQVSALARRAGLNVLRRDLFGLRGERLTSTLRRLVEEHQPRMIGFTLRQADSQVSFDYFPTNERRIDYFPVDDTRDAISVVRQWSNARIVIGGFGFTTQPRSLFNCVDADYGIIGEPDDFIARFEDVLAGRQLSTVANLLWREDGVVRENARVFAPPLEATEYSDEILQEIYAFYGANKLLSEDAEAVCVEVARGCPYRCYFCTEPAVKGKRVRERSLSVVEEDVTFLRNRGIRNIWFVCSELNIGDNDLGRRLAELMLRINDGLAVPIAWRAYYLPRWFSRQDLQLLYRSGFRGGWDDFPSLEDANLKACRVPYRADDAKRSLLDALSVSDEAGVEFRSGGTYYSFFLGNAFATPESIAKTLRFFDENRLADRFSEAMIRAATRAYPPCPETVPSSEDVISVDRIAGRVAMDLTKPSFVYPPHLAKAFGGPEKVHEFFQYIVSTFLTQDHRRWKKWNWFLCGHTSPDRLRKMWKTTLGSIEPEMDGVPADVAAVVTTLIRDPEHPCLSELFTPSSRAASGDQGYGPIRTAAPEYEDSRSNQAAFLMLRVLMEANRGELESLFAALELPFDIDPDAAQSEYRIVRALNRRWQSSSDLFETATRNFGRCVADPDCALLLLNAVLYAWNARINPLYSNWLFV